MGYADTVVEETVAVVDTVVDAVLDTVVDETVTALEVEEALLLAVGCTGVISTGARSASSTEETVGGGARDIGMGTGMTVDLGLIFLGAGGAVEEVEVVTGVEGKTLIIGISELETPLLIASS